MIDDPFDLTDDDFAPPFPPLHPLPGATPQANPPAPPAPAPPPWLAGLNPEQFEAVTRTEGPLLVLSGAGTGKTRVLTTRLAHILARRLAPPWNCLCVTFTNRAAREMRERVANMIGPLADQVWLGTFHALGVRMLRKYGEHVGLRPGFTILDSDDQLRLLKPLLEERKIDSKENPPNVLMGIIQRWKDRGWRPEAVPASEQTSLANGKLGELYQAYQQRLLTVNACDFGDLLLHCLTLFQQQPDILARYQQQFRYILVDEYQDTNVSQYLWLRLLSVGHRNICCVGDDDQSIYSWRGAEVANILRFDHDFPGAHVVRLESNYRSTPAILGAASGLIRHNSGRLGKELRAAGKGRDENEKVSVYGLASGDDEARHVVELVEERQRQGVSLSGMAILVRAGSQTRAFEERLLTTGTRYKVVGGLRFYERQEIRDAIAYLRLVEQPADDLALERIINTPRRGLGDATLQTIHLAARAQGLPLLAAARSVLDTDELKAKARTTLAGFVALRDEWAALKGSLPLHELMEAILDQSGYLDMWRKDKSPEAPGRVENLQELLTALQEFASPGEFLEHIALVMENDARAGEGEALTIMTLHAAKGLEFDVVFLPGWEEDIFPNRRALEGNGIDALEEERRLAYVGLTRARKKAFITWAASRRVFNQWQNNPKSRFIGEIPDDFKEEDTDSGMPVHGGQGLYEGWGSWNGGWEQRVPQRPATPAKSAPAWKSTRPSGKAAPSFTLGSRVFHQKFGYGNVIAADGDKLEVDFDNSGRKKVVASFVSAA